MYNGSLQNNFKKRRKVSFSLKPVNPISPKTGSLAKFLRYVSSCFKRRKVISLENVTNQNPSCIIESRKSKTVFTNEQRDISPILREITANFFENEFKNFSDNTIKIRQPAEKIKSESSLSSIYNPLSKTNCRRKRPNKLSKINVTESISDLELRATKQCVSASAFLTTSFFSLVHKPEYSTYPIHIDLHYAEEDPAKDNKSSQYCDKDFMELNKHAKTSTRGLQHFCDNATQSEKVCDSNDFMPQSIAPKIAHYFEISPLKKGRTRSTSRDYEKVVNFEKINKSTNTSTVYTAEEEPTLLYVNSTRQFVSTDDTTIMESKLDFDEESLKYNIKRRKSQRRSRQLITKNCSTSTSDSRAYAQMNPKLKEWYDCIHNDTTDNVNFRHIGQLKGIASTTMSTPIERHDRKSNSYYVSESIAENSFSNTNLNKQGECSKSIRKLSDCLADDVNNLRNDLRTSFNELDNYTHQRNLMDILNQRYPTFIGFQFNNNESTRKVRYSINKKVVPNRKNKVPKIIIREQKKQCNICESESGHVRKPSQSNSKISVVSMKSNNGKVLEIREIIEGLLPKEQQKFKMISSDYLQNNEPNQKGNRTPMRSDSDDVLRLEVEKMVDELLDEVPSRSREVDRRSSRSSYPKVQTDNWNLRNDYSCTSLSNDLELHPFDRNVFDTIYAENFPSQTVIPLFHRFKIRETSKKIRSEDKVRFHLVTNDISNIKPSLNSEDVVENNSTTNLPSCPKSASNEIDDVHTELEEHVNAKEITTEYKPDKHFYAQIVQSTGSAEHPLVCSKISSQSTKSSVHSFIKSLLLCLKYTNSHAIQHHAAIQCDPLGKQSPSKVRLKKKHPTTTSSCSPSPNFDVDKEWSEKKLSSIFGEPERIDESCMFSQQMNTVGIQVLIAKHMRDKKISSPSLTQLLLKRCQKQDTGTQTRVNAKMNTSSHAGTACLDTTSSNKEATVYSSASKKVSEIQTCTENIGIFPTTVVQEVNYSEVKNPNFCTFSEEHKYNKEHENMLQSKSTQGNVKKIRRRKSNYAVSSPWNSDSEIAKYKRKVAGYSKLGDGDKFSLHTYFRKLVNPFSLSFCNPTIVSVHIIQNVFSDTRNYYMNSNHNFLEPLFSSNYTKKQTRPSILVYAARTLIKQKQPSTKSLKFVQPDETTSTENSKNTSPDMRTASEIQGQPDSLSSSRESIDKDNVSDIYKFKPTETVLDDIYLEHMRDLWLKSGLRKHLSQLSNLKLRPIHVWRKVLWPDINGPLPVLEELDMEPTDTDLEPLSQSNIKIPSTPQKRSSARLDKSVSLFDKLKRLEKNDKYEIEINRSSSSSSSSSSGDQSSGEENMEPALANVGSSLEKLDEDFIDWVLALGIPLSKISPRAVQTSLEYFQQKIPEVAATKSECTCNNTTDSTEEYIPRTSSNETRRSKTPDKPLSKPPVVWKSAMNFTTTESEQAQIPCSCNDNTESNEKSSKLSTLKKRLQRKLNNSNICIVTKENESDTSNDRILESSWETIPSKPKNKATALKEVSILEPLNTKDNIQKEIVCIIDDIINQLQSKIQERALENPELVQKAASVKGGLNPSYCSFDYCGLGRSRNVPKTHEIKTEVKFDEKIMVRNPDVISDKQEEAKPSVLKHLRHYIKHRSNTPPRHTQNYKDAENNLHAGLNTGIPEKYNFQESVKSLGDKLKKLNRPKKGLSTVPKIIREKVYSSRSRTETKENLGISEDHSSADDECKNKLYIKLKQKLKIQIRDKTSSNYSSQQHTEKRIFANIKSQAQERKKQKMSNQKIIDKSKRTEDTLEDCYCEFLRPNSCNKHKRFKDEYGNITNTGDDYISTSTSFSYSPTENEGSNKTDNSQTKDGSYIYKVCLSNYKEERHKVNMMSVQDENLKRYKRITKYRQYNNERRKIKWEKNTKRKSKDLKAEMHKDKDTNSIDYINQFNTILRNFIWRTTIYDQLNSEEVTLDKEAKESLLFAIKSLAKLIVKFYIKFICPDLINFDTYVRSKERLNVNRKPSNELDINNSSTNFSCSSIGNYASNTKDIFSIHKLSATVSETSSRGYFSDSSVEDGSSFPPKRSLGSASENILTHHSETLKRRITNHYRFDKKTKSEGFLLDDQSKLSTRRKINAITSSVASNASINIKSKHNIKEAVIRKSLDDFFADIFHSWKRSESNMDIQEPCASRSQRISTEARYRKLCKVVENHSEQATHFLEEEDNSNSESNSKIYDTPNISSHCLSTVSKLLSTADYSYRIGKLSDLSEHPSQTSLSDLFNSENSQEMNDVWEIIKLLSKLCPRVLCKYYIKRMLG